MKNMFARTSLLVLALFSFALQAAPASRVLGPEQAGQDYYQIGNQRLKLRALIIESVDARSVADVIDSYRAQRGTHDWNWKIGYTNLPAQQSAVLAWNNLDSNESGWIAVAHDAQGNWFKMSSRKMTWIDYKDTHIIRKDTTNGYDVISRISKTGASSIAYAFSRTMR